MNCDFQHTDGTTYRCRRCGYTAEVSHPPLRRKCPASAGLGDTIAGITKWFGVKPCGGCKKRQRLLNRLFPYK